jgi:outer membrane protein assembly factor BamB
VLKSIGTTISCSFVTIVAAVLVVGSVASASRASLQELPPGIRWSKELSAAPTTPPVISGDRIFLASLPGVVSVRDIKDGSELWTEPVNPEQPVVVFGDHVFIAAGEAVQALQVADRAIAWRASTGTVTAPLLVKDGWVIAASETRMVALRASDGTEVWQRETSLQRERGAIDGNTLYVPLVNGRLQAIDITTGKVRWERPLGGSPAEPLVVGDRVYVGATNKYFYSVDASDSDIEWSIRVGSSIRGRASTDGERIFFAGLDNLVRALGRGSGSLRWQEGIPFRPFAAPAVFGDALYVAGPVPEIRLLSARTGKESGKIAFSEPLVIAPGVGTLSTGETVVAAVTGALNESWKLWLASATPAPAAK